MLAAAGAASLAVVLLAGVSWPISAALSGNSAVAGPFAGNGGTPHAPVPADLVPRLEDARADLPHAVRDSCQVNDASVSLPPQCVYSRKDALVTLVLVGDSKASQWGDAFDQIATYRGWRLEVYTKSSCGFVDAPEWLHDQARAFDECSAWRDVVLARLATERPQLVVIANGRARQMVIDGAPVYAYQAPGAWGDALSRLVIRVRSVARHVIVLGDTPRPRVDVPVCLSGHRDDMFQCATPRSTAVVGVVLDAEAAAAKADGATYIDPSPWVCPTDPCPVVLGRFLVYRDGEHLANTFTASLSPELLDQLPVP